MNELKFDCARFEAGEMPTRTRNGGKVLHIYNSGIDCDYPIVAWIKNDYGCITTETYNANGYVYYEKDPYINDLVHEPKIIHRIGNRYQHQSGQKYVLALVEDEVVTLINTEVGTRYAESTAVDNAFKLSEAEWDTLTLGCGDDFKLITP